MSSVPARLPLAALVPFVLAALAFVAALLCFAGAGALLHPA